MSPTARFLRVHVGSNRLLSSWLLRWTEGCGTSPSTAAGHLCLGDSRLHLVSLGHLFQKLPGGEMLQVRHIFALFPFRQLVCGLSLAEELGSFRWPLEGHPELGVAYGDCEIGLGL